MRQAPCSRGPTEDHAIGEAWRVLGPREDVSKHEALQLRQVVLQVQDEVQMQFEEVYEKIDKYTRFKEKRISGISKGGRVCFWHPSYLELWCRRRQA